MLSTLAESAVNGHAPVIGKLVHSKTSTPLGSMIAVADDAALYLPEFENRAALTGELRSLERDSGLISQGSNTILEMLDTQLCNYFAGKSANFQMAMILHGTAFEEAVWEALKRIPRGQTRSYGDIAEELGQPENSRAVGRANSANKISIIVACHRVIGSDGSFVGYGGGLWRKKWLLDHERQYAWASFE